LEAGRSLLPGIEADICVDRGVEEEEGMEKRKRGGE
jgi:hypothetical protein